MSDSTKKIIGLLLMMVSLYMILGGVYVNYGYIDELVLAIGIALLCIGFTMYKLLKEKEE